MILLTANATHMDRACSEVRYSEALRVCGHQPLKTVLEDQSEEWQDADAFEDCVAAIAKVGPSGTSVGRLRFSSKENPHARHRSISADSWSTVALDGC